MPTKHPSRNYTLDLIRLVAAFGVVFIHVHTQSEAAKTVSQFFLVLCVPFFFVTSLVYFASGLNATLSIRDVLRKMAMRIGVPFLAWSMIYTGLLVAKDMLRGGQVRPIDLIRVFGFGESAEQMYYLPELIIMQIIILSLFLLVVSKNRLAGVGLLVAGIGYLAWGYANDYYGVTPVASVVLYITAGVYLASGMAIANKRMPGLAIGVTLMLLSFLGNAGAIPVINKLPIGGLGLFLVALNLPNTHLSTGVKTISSTTFGIYLSHVLFLEGLEFALEKSHVVLYYDMWTKLLLTGFIFAVSLVFTLMAKQIGFVKMILLGEGK